MNEVGTVEQNAHLRHRPLALLNLVFRRARFRALIVVGLDLLDKLAVGNNARRTAFVEDGFGDAVLHGFYHGIFIHDSTKDLHRRIYRRACEANIGGIRQRIAQVLGKTKRAFHACLRNGQLFLQIGLRTVRFIADTDDVGPIGKQIDILREFLYSSKEHTSAGAALQFGFQILATLHLLYHAVAHKLLGVEQQARELVVQISTVSNQNDGGTAQGFALHQQSRQEEHRQRLAATRSTKVGAAFAVASCVEFAVVQYILKKRAGGEILRITADELALVFRGVREIDEVVNHIDKSVFAEHSGNHRLERVDAVAGLVFGIHFAPGIEEFIWGVKGAEFTVHAIGDHKESRVFEQGGYVSAVADGELFVGILDSGVLLGGTLQLEHHHGQTIDEDDDVGYAVLDFGDVELVHHLENVVFLIGFVESDGVDVQVLLGGIFAFQREAVHQQVEGVFVLSVECAALFLRDDADGILHLLVGDAVVLVAVVQICRQIIAQHHLVEVAFNLFAPEEFIVLLLQQSDNGLF